MRFKLLRGVHQEAGVTYSPGAVFDSKTDLLTENRVKSEPRFERLPDELPRSDPEETRRAAMAGYEDNNMAKAAPPRDSLDGMTVEELRQFAAESEVDLGKARTKDQILAVLRSA